MPIKGVVGLPTVPNIYEVPLILEDEGLGDLIIESLGLPKGGRDLNLWRAMVAEMKEPKERLSIAVVGKYVDLPDSYISVKEALKHAGLFHGRDVEVRWVHSEELERQSPEAFLQSVCGIVVPGGFGPRGIEGMIRAVRYARENRVPYLGLCLGMQVMVAEFARFALGKGDANSTEFNPTTSAPVIDILPEQREIKDMGGTMRLGSYPCRVVDNSWASKAYGVPLVHERHRHRFEFNNYYRESLEASGLWPTGLSPDGNLVEIVEIPDHPFMVGVQFHPEFLSRPNRPHPLFREFVGVSKGIIREGSQHPLPLDHSGLVRREI